MHAFRLLLAVLTLAITAPASGVTPYLVADINPSPQTASSWPWMLASFGDIALFEPGSYSDPVSFHRSLWRSDGTAGGTYKLLEDTGSIKVVAVARGRCFLSVGSFNPELWVTDGYPGGTYRLHQGPLTVPDRPHLAAWVSEQSVLYFAAQVSGPQDLGLWRSDGTPAGTYQVAGAPPGVTGFSPEELTSFQGRVYFAATAESGGSPVLWRSDGTPQGTAPLLDPRSAPTAGFLQKVGSRLVFVGGDPAHGQELWSSDGTARGTRRIADLVPGPGSPQFFDFAVHRRQLYFLARLTPEEPTQLWVTDGTAGGTRMLTRFDAHSGFTLLPKTSPLSRFVFAAFDELHGQEIWATDGTVQGTGRVRDICPGACSGFDASSSSFVFHQGRLYFAASRRSRGTELWTTDGTGSGTRMVRDICPGSCSSSPAQMVSVGSRLLFRATDGVQYGLIWSTDGTASGTISLGPAPFYDADLSEGVTAGQRLIFAATDSGHGRELWCMDGTPAGTYLLADLEDQDLGGSFPGNLMAMGSTVLFFAKDEIHGDEIWRSDGTAEGTSRVTELLPGAEPSWRTGFLKDWTALAGRVFFSLSYGFDAVPGGVKFPPAPWPYALWTSDGTAAGTYRLTPKGVQRFDHGTPLVACPPTSQVFFSATDVEHGTEPWVTDGTVEGTHLLADLQPGSGSSYPSKFTLFRRSIWFVTYTGAGNQLWRSDGTEAGTVQVGPSLGEISGLSVFQGGLWFLVSGDELWSTDGTTAGTRRRLTLPSGLTAMFSDVERLYLSDYREGLWVSDGTEAGTRKISPWGMTDARVQSGNRFFYSSGNDLFVTDGTEAGTRWVRPTSNQQLHATRLVALGSRVLALTYDGEIWQTDGTDSGTTPLRAPAPSGSNYATEMVRAGSRVFFPGWDPKTGWELWAVRE